jgi:hypothetical protein
VVTAADSKRGAAEIFATNFAAGLLYSLPRALMSLDAIRERKIDARYVADSNETWMEPDVPGC